MYKQNVYRTIFMTMTTLCFGQSISEQSSIKQNYELLKNMQQPQDPFIESTKGVEGSLPKKATIFPYKPLFEDFDNVNKHFGYNFFTIRDTISFWENLPTLSNYVLGPGDELVISLWGETQLRQKYTITREGKIYDEKVGLLSLGGKTIDSADNFLRDQYSRVYSTLGGISPSTFFDVSLGQLRSINVNFVGHVKYPGVYTIHPFSNLITGLVQAGGIDTTGTLRLIQLKRNGKLDETVDLYKYFLEGESSSNIQLRDQDIIFVPPRKSYISIDSAVVRPGIYESLKGESVFDMINYAAGPTYDAGYKIGLRRIKLQRDNVTGLNYEAIYFDYNNSSEVVASSGDEIIVQRLFDEVHEVELIGQVKSPGKYYYFKGMTLKDLLDLGSGLSDSTFMNSVNLLSAEIIRRDTNHRYENVIFVNLKDVIDNGKAEKIFLSNLDKVVLHANLNFFEKENIVIRGEVNVPGAYPLTSDNESLKSLIDRAGGLTPKAQKDGIAIYRDRGFFEDKKSEMDLIFQNEINNNRKNILDDKKLRVAWQNLNISLMPGDSIIVKEKMNTVFVTGAIYNPGILEFQKGKSINYYINSAGGLTDMGNRKGIVLLYPNGVVRPKKWYTSPRVIEGSTIVVNEKSIEAAFNLTQFATNWSSIISSFVTILLLSQQI